MPKEKPESPPAFLFYGRAFYGDENVVVMDWATKGRYQYLLWYLWENGTIPDDPKKVAAIIGNTSDDDMAVAWPLLRACFSESEADATRLVSPRLEVERAVWKHKSEQARASGKRGGLARSAKRQPFAPPPPERPPSAAVATVKPTLTDASADVKPSESNVNSNINGVTTLRSVTPRESGANAKQTLQGRYNDDAPLDDDELDIPATARESALSPSLSLARWFVHRGIESGAFPEVYKSDIDRYATATAEIAAANRLIATYSLPAIRAAADKMFARRMLHKAHPEYLRAFPTLAFLADRWTMFDEPTVRVARAASEALSHREGYEG